MSKLLLEQIIVNQVAVMETLQYIIDGVGSMATRETERLLYRKLQSRIQESLDVKNKYKP